jgi:superfamily II RNA helicase
MNIYDLESEINNEEELQQKYKSCFKIEKEDFKFDKFQLISFREIDNLYNVLVSAPTSSGKTAVAEYGLISTIQKEKKVIYTSPIKSLSNEKYKEFKDRNICSVGLLTGDNKINVDAQCLIMTAEILRNSLYKKDQISEDIGCVIMDEVHFINDPDRGKIWEETIIMLPQHVQIIMLSATINNVEQFAKWIHSIRKKNLSLIKSSKRIVPLNYYIYSNELYKILDNNDTFDDLTYFESKRKYEKIKKDRQKDHKSPVDPSYFDKIVKFLIKKDLLQAIFFSFSRLNCEKYARTITSILTSEESTNTVNMFDFLMKKYHKDYEFIPQYIQVRQLIQKGICFHHSGLIPIIKEIIEILFRDGFLKVLFATETFAVGVNMPTRTVVFTELTKPTNMTKRFLNTAEFKQMSGRAGRRGKDVIGHVILLPYYEFPELLDLKSVMLQSMPSITSKFSIDYYYSLKTIDMKDNLYNKSLLNSEQLDSIISEQENLVKLKTILMEYTTFSDTDIDNFEKQYKLDNFNSQNTFLKLSKNQEKELKFLKQNNQDDYKLYFEKNTLIKKINSLTNDIEYIKLYCNTIHKIVTNILIDEGYIKYNNLNEIILDAFGVAVIQCNECNGILITEMIKNNIFDNMDGNDIIAFLSIFVSYKNDKFKSQYYVSEYKKVLEIVDKWASYETKHKLNICSEEFWETTNGYIDIVYDWVTLDMDDNKNMGHIITQLQNMNEYEGNFVKNMLKIYNVCVCVKGIFELLNKPDLVIKLDNLDQKILKNIVNVNSLYLN